MDHYDASAVLKGISSLNFSGNVIPVEWLKMITFPNGKPDLIAIMILADIVYWYRLTPVRDEATGVVIGYRKKFKADMLQRSYEAFAQQLGITKRQATDAIKRLEIKGLIHKEFRVVKTAQTTLNNILFLAPIPDAVQALSYPVAQPLPPADVTPPPLQRNPSHVATGDPLTLERERVSRPDVTPLTSERETYTAITTETNTEITTIDRQLGASAVCNEGKKGEQKMPSELLPSQARLNETQDCLQLKTPTATLLANTAEKNNELASVIEWLQSHGISARQLNRKDEQTLLQQLLAAGATLELFQQALVKAQRSKRGQTFGLFYLRPIVEELLAYEQRQRAGAFSKKTTARLLKTAKPMHYASDFTQAAWALED